MGLPEKADHRTWQGQGARTGRAADLARRGRRLAPRRGPDRQLPEWKAVGRPVGERLLPWAREKLRREVAQAELGEDVRHTRERTAAPRGRGGTAGMDR
jgi:hypothetical protein